MPTQIQLPLNERIASVPEITLTADTDAISTNTINADFIAAEQTFAINSNIDELVGDGKVQEFMQYIEHIDSETATGDKLNFQEFSDASKRMRYPSYNTGGEVDEEIDEFTIIVADDIETDEETTESQDTASAKPIESKRKTNMFAKDSGRFVEYERMNEAKQLQSASTSDILQSQEKPRESLVKSKTVDQFLSSVGSFASTTDSGDTDALKVDRIDPEIRVIESPSIETITRRESLTSDVSNESSYFNFKRSSDSESAYAYNREDSWLSYDSNMQFDRSLSTFSDLEYIRGRDDWREHQSSRLIPSEIDSDDYHHHRRFSENSDALEYIRGREDWLKNEMNAVRSCTLPRIFEQGDRKFLIQDEIDSDEYHHSFYLQEAVRTATELGPRFLVHGSARSGRARSPYKVLHAEIDKNEFLQRYYWKGANELPTDDPGFKLLPLEKHDVAEEKMIRSERLIWIQNENSRSQSPLAVEVNAIKVTKSESPPPTTTSSAGNRMASESDVEYEQEIRSEEINQVIDNIIDAKILTEDSLGQSPTEDIEIMVLDLAEKKPKRSKPPTEPFIIISEATDDETEASTDGTLQKCDAESGEVMQSNSSLQEENVDVVVDVESFEFVNAPMEIDEEQPNVNNNAKNEQRQIDIEKNTLIGTATAEPQAKGIDVNQTKINEKSAQNKSAERFDDLIKEGSMGLWFHK